MKTLSLIIILSLALTACSSVKPKKEFVSPINGGVILEDVWLSAEDVQMIDLKNRAERKAKFMERNSFR